jgi:hypothetical protein
MSYYWHARREPLPPGTKVSRDVVRRVWGFARDFRWQIAGYLFLLALSSLAASCSTPPSPSAASPWST